MVTMCLHDNYYDHRLVHQGDTVLLLVPALMSNGCRIQVPALRAEDVEIEITMHKGTHLNPI